MSAEGSGALVLFKLPLISATSYCYLSPVSPQPGLSYSTESNGPVCHLLDVNNIAGFSADSEI